MVILGASEGNFGVSARLRNVHTLLRPGVILRSTEGTWSTARSSSGQRASSRVARARPSRQRQAPGCSRVSGQGRPPRPASRGGPGRPPRPMPSAAWPSVPSRCRAQVEAIEAVADPDSCRENGSGAMREHRPLSFPPGASLRLASLSHAGGSRHGAAMPRGRARGRPSSQAWPARSQGRRQPGSSAMASPFRLRTPGLLATRLIRPFPARQPGRQICGTRGFGPPGPPLHKLAGDAAVLERPLDRERGLSLVQGR